MEPDGTAGEEAFTRLFASFERPLWQAVAAAAGVEAADDAVAEAWAYAWANWDRIATMANPKGYLYVAATRYAQHARRRSIGPTLPTPAASELPASEPGLVAALNRLTEHQRTVVFLVIACQWRVTEVAELLELSPSTVRNHLSRGMAHLRDELEVELDAHA